jgi:hypothetical protein
MGSSESWSFSQIIRPSPMFGVVTGRKSGSSLLESACMSFFVIRNSLGVFATNTNPSKPYSEVTFCFFLAF